MNRLYKWTKIAFSSPVFVMSLLYIIAFWPMLFNTGIFDDDWTYQTPEGYVLLKNYLSKSVLFHRFYAFIFDTPLFGTVVSFVVFRTITFLSYLIGGILVYLVLKKQRYLTDIQSVVLSLIILVIPVNHARVYVGHSHYNICYLFFAIGLFFLVQYLKHGNFYLRIGAILSFCIAFITPTFAFFFYAILPFLIYNELDSFSFRNFYNKLIRTWDFVLLPVAHFTLSKLLITAKHAIYNQTYYNIKLSVFSQISGMAEYLYNTTIKRAEEIFASPFDVLNVVVVVGLVSVLVFMFYQTKQEKFRGRNVTWFICGAGLLVFSIVPYYAIGQQVVVYGRSSRGEILAGIGLAVLLCAAMFSVSKILHFPRFFRYLFFAIIIVKVTDCTLHQQMQYIKVAFINESLLINIAKNADIRELNSIAIKYNQSLDNHPHSANSDRYRYRYLFNKPFADKNKFVIMDNSSYDKIYNKYQKLLSADNIARDFANLEFFVNKNQEMPKKLEGVVVINDGETNLSDLKVIKLILLRLGNHKEYSEIIQNITTLKVIKFGSSEE